jgi:hypothetical protein
VEGKLAVASVDFAAVGRVSRYAELKDIRVTGVSATCDPKYAAPLEAKFSHHCFIVSKENGTLGVSCEYGFSGSAAETKIVDIAIKYLVTYTLNTTEPLDENDLAQFATANGTLHSWPFVRELLNGLTSRMGVPPFTLGVMHFAPAPAPQQAQKAPENAGSQT